MAWVGLEVLPVVGVTDIAHSFGGQKNDREVRSVGSGFFHRQRWQRLRAEGSVVW